MQSVKLLFVCLMGLFRYPFYGIFGIFFLFNNCLVLISCAAIHGRLKEQIKGIDAVKVRDVELFWYGMAEVRNISIFIHVQFF